MCTMIAERVAIQGSGKGREGWFTLRQANVSYDHPFDAPLEHALNIDFVNEEQGPGARVAVELSPGAARDLGPMKIFYDFNSQEIFCDRRHQQAARMGERWRNVIVCGNKR